MVLPTNLWDDCGYSFLIIRLGLVVELRGGHRISGHRINMSVEVKGVPARTVNGIPRHSYTAGSIN